MNIQTESESDSEIQIDQQMFDTLGPPSCTMEIFHGLVALSIPYYVKNLRISISELNFSTDKKLLIFRTANTHLVEALLTALFRENPSIKVDLVVQNSFLPNIKDKNVTPYLIPDGEITKASFSDELIARINNKHYSAVLVPYSNNCGQGYENIHTIVRGFSIEKMYGLGSNGRLYKIQRFPLLKKIVVAPAAIVSFFFMFLLLTGMALWFKVFLPAKRWTLRHLYPK